MEGDFPPSSRVTRLSVLAAAMLILIPVPTLPVKEIYTCKHEERRGRGYLVDVGMFGEETTGVSFADDTVEDTGWEPSFFEESSEVHCRKTVSFTGFDDEGISCGESRSTFRGQKQEGDVERGDTDAYSQRFMTDDLG